MTIKIDPNELFLVTTVLNGSSDTYGYIDLDTGDVLHGSAEYPIEDFFPDEEADNFEELEAEFKRRYLPISSDSQAGYQDMKDFIETLENQRLRELLEVAIQGSGAFGRFKDVLHRPDFAQEESQWFEFKEQQPYNRTINWLNSVGLSIA